ncbi:MAG: class C sortase, partial [Oscillospiraceae bacterium]|nr:class C sortase [Oscillospiraceae bacterium]
MIKLIRKHWLDIVIVLMFLIGLSVLLYPSVSSYINAKHASRAITLYSSSVNNASDEAIAGMMRIANEYNKQLAGDRSAFYLPDSVNGYETALDVTGTGIMGYIDIGKIGVQLPIYHGVDPAVLQVGVGHLEGTSLPVGGKNTHCVLSGHRGLPSARLFTDLDKMEVGDTFTITVLRQTLIYQVDQIKIVLPSESQDLQIENDKDYCTLLTSTPYGSNTHRLLVRGVRIRG